MQLFDLHCDTLYRAVTEQKTLNEPLFHLSVNRGLVYSKWTQILAVWVPDDLRKAAAFTFAKNAILHLKETMQAYRPVKLVDNFNQENTHRFCLAIEGGAALAGDLTNIAYFRKLGVRFLTLTWNGENEIGDGAGAEQPKGITLFGQKAVSEMEKQGIVIDVSHASDPLFFDVAEMAQKPFVATHSNARKICNHKRNLTNEQFNIIKNAQGIVGLNFCPHFLTEDKEAGMADLLKHTEHFLSLGGEDTVCLGSDFDGTDMPQDICGIESMANLYEYYLKHNYPEALVKKIFYENANAFCQNFDK